MDCKINNHAIEHANDVKDHVVNHIVIQQHEGTFVFAFDGTFCLTYMVFAKLFRNINKLVFDNQSHNFFE